MNPAITAALLLASVGGAMSVEHDASTLLPPRQRRTQHVEQPRGERGEVGPSREKRAARKRQKKARKAQRHG